ncbi:LytTR family DNA-binding domain-containing protein [Hansschlegelia plantiphila]|uniref:HTH LytTR-type domain-containing protein n=1 Tax=Hansschlegelia plantiphila TaxID=374655 RepID=A0A9W6J252_9HYPH|nr:LytTR family DNA-binding domain-containing protein [Hansschlegelia plantiphila]GLK67880.1 hypothetical protein GCM10008179_15180 [Hansschlegelia plantiphila]
MRDFANVQGGDWLRRRSAEACLALALGLAFALLGPYSTDQQPFLARLGFWAGLLACWFVVATLVGMALGRVELYRRAGRWSRQAVIVGLTAAPMILVVAPAAHALTGWQASLSEVVELYWQTALIGCVVALVSTAVLAPSPETAGHPAPAGPQTAVDAAERRDDGGDQTATDAAVQSRLVARLPSALRGRLLCLEMEDHYVRVHTDQGSSLVLLRLSDAINEAAPISGGQVHRSWWVSDEAIEAFERTGRTAQLRLTNGLMAPVSQRYLKATETAVVARG